VSSNSTLRATVNTDASFCPHTRAGGWAVWISIDGGIKVKKSGMFKDRPRTSTEAELWAIFNGVWIAASMGVASLLVQSDCKTALAHLERNTMQTRQLHASLPCPVTIKTKHVKAHRDTDTARTWVNEWCDTEAKKWMRYQRNA
jgi:ribonuclease HI